MTPLRSSSFSISKLVYEIFPSMFPNLYDDEVDTNEQPKSWETSRTVRTKIDPDKRSTDEQ